MKKKYYLLSFIAPMLLLFIVSTLCGYIPFKDYTFNKFDAFYEYPTFLVELGRMLREGSSVFYTLHAGMGVNFFSILNLYGGSPLNIFSVFFDNTTIYIFYTILIYLKLGLSGLTMSIYLNSLNTKYKDTIWNVLFSLIYATSGWVIAMSMHIMWLDAYILLPLIIKGLDKLILTNKYLEYTLFLALAIITNYYTGFMLCLFMVIYFVYKTLTTNNFNKKTILRFIIFSLVAALISSVILIPTIFNLLGGRFSNLEFTFDYLSIDWYNLLSSVYNMTIASFVTADHKDFGTTTLYITIFCLALIVSYFFNSKISKKNKIITFITIFFFHLSFAIPLLDYAWNMLQKPLWWEHRYQFVYVFFTILIAYESFCKSDSIKLSSKKKSLITILFMLLLILSFSYKVKGMGLSDLNVVIVFISILLFYIYLKSPKKANKWLIMLIIAELSINTYSTLYLNRGFLYSTLMKETEEVNQILTNIDKDYRTTTTYVDSGLLFGFNSLEIFSSSNNAQVIAFLNDLNVSQRNKNAIILQSHNPAVYSLLGLKHFVGTSEYFECENDLCTNEYALPIMYSVDASILDIKLSDNFKENINNIYSSLLKEEIDIFYNIPLNVTLKNVKIDDEGYFYDSEEDASVSISAKAEQDSLIIFNSNQTMLQEEATIYINDEEYIFPENSDYLLLLKAGDSLTIVYEYDSISLDDISFESHSFTALDPDLYENAIKEIKAKTNYKNIEDNNYILKGEIKVNDDLLLITIPYDKGLKIKVDGKEAPYFKVLDTLIGIDIEEGSHTIEITYFPQGLKAGSLISLLSLAILLIYPKIKNKRKKQKLTY